MEKLSQRDVAGLIDISALKIDTSLQDVRNLIEAMLLTDDQIRDACRIVMDSGADYVKSGTGFSAEPTTLHHVRVMKDTVGDNIKIKVAGGVCDLSTLVTMHAMGVHRFGIGMAAGIAIIEEAGKSEHSW